MADQFEDRIERFNEQLGRKGLESFNLKKLSGTKPDLLVVAGMGGSGLAAEILQSLTKFVGLKVPLIIWKNYGLPDIRNYGARKPLYIFVSFSGNTEETISGLTEALRSKKLAAVVASGGELQRMAERRDLPFVIFPPAGLEPRQAPGRMFYSIIEILRAANLVSGKDLDCRHLKPLEFRALGKELAKKLLKRLVLVYSDEADRDLGYIWKITLNETAKTEAFSNIIPEMNHNELVGLSNSHHPTAAIFVHKNELGPRLKKRISINKKLLKAQGVRIVDHKQDGRNDLERRWNTIMLATWTAYYMALKEKVDPKEVRIVEKLKELMRK